MSAIAAHHGEQGTEVGTDDGMDHRLVGVAAAMVRDASKWVPYHIAHLIDSLMVTAKSVLRNNYL